MINQRFKVVSNFFRKITLEKKKAIESDRNTKVEEEENLHKMRRSAGRPTKTMVVGAHDRMDVGRELKSKKSNLYESLESLGEIEYDSSRKIVHCGFFHQFRDDFNPHEF